jgi:hypothetical protein
MWTKAHILMIDKHKSILKNSFLIFVSEVVLVSFWEYTYSSKLVNTAYSEHPTVRSNICQHSVHPIILSGLLL